MRDEDELSLYEKSAALLVATALVLAGLTTIPVAAIVLSSLIKVGHFWPEELPFVPVIRAYAISGALFSIALLMHWDRLWLFIRYHIGKRL